MDNKLFKLAEYLMSLLTTEEKQQLVENKKEVVQIIPLVENNPNEPKFLEILRQFLTDLQVVEGLSESTIFKHEKLYKNISDFLFSIGMQFLHPKDFKVRTADALKVWLHNNLKSCTLTHSARHIEMIKRCLNQCLNDEIITANPLAAYKAKRSRVKIVVHITEDEMDMLLRYPFQSEILQQATHVYLFQCGTGLSYGDLKHYQYENLSDAEWFTNSRKKNDESYYVPVFPLSKTIYNHYKGKLPNFNNGAYNRYLKEIAAITCIKKHLTTHTARKTFATLKYGEGYSIEAISQMLGQKSVKTTETHYLVRDRQRILKEKTTIDSG